MSRIPLAGHLGSLYGTGGLPDHYGGNGYLPGDVIRGVRGRVRYGYMADVPRKYLRMADEDLISLVAGSDPAAFSALYDRHGGAAYSLAYRMMGERTAAEDLVQDVFMKVWRSASGYRVERGSVRTWILSILHNRGVDQLRSLASRRRTQDRVEANAPRAQPSEAFASAWRNTQRDQIRQALDTLPDEQLRILELAYFSGYTHVEIADLLNIPLGTVKGRMRLGLKKIKGFFDAREMAVPR